MGSNEGSNGKPRFEPPPWEREAFDALAARRADEQRAREALDAAAAAAMAAAEKQVTTPADLIAEALAQSAPAEAQEAAPDEQAAGDAVVPDAEVVAEEPASPAKPLVEPTVVNAMLMQLASEERTETVAVSRVSQAVAALLMVLGGGMLIGGISLMRSANGKQIIIIGSLVLTVFGMMFMGMAVWVWIATNRSRGRS